MGAVLLKNPSDTWNRKHVSELSAVRHTTPETENVQLTVIESTLHRFFPNWAWLHVHWDVNSQNSRY
jgi:hypothetical protein